MSRIYFLSDRNLILSDHKMRWVEENMRLKIFDGFTKITYYLIYLKITSEIRFHCFFQCVRLKKSLDFASEFMFTFYSALSFNNNKSRNLS